MSFRWITKFQARSTDALSRHPVAALTGVFLGGMIFWGAFNWSLELTNTEQFCLSCHAMREYVYKEYKTTIHYSNRTGVRASCPDCHVPREWVHKVVRKIRATNELFHWIIGSIDAPEDFEAKRPVLAKQVWKGMRASDSRECRNCHGNDYMKAQSQAPMGREMHKLALTWRMTCIDCHKGIAHSLPRTYDKDALLNTLHDRMEKEKVDCRRCHEDIAGPPKGDDW